MQWAEAGLQEPHGAGCCHSCHAGLAGDRKSTQKTNQLAYVAKRSENRAGSRTQTMSSEIFLRSSAPPSLGLASLLAGCLQAEHRWTLRFQAYISNWVGQRGREGERERQGGGDEDTERDRDTEGERHTERKLQSEKKRETERRERDRERERQREQDTKRASVREIHFKKPSKGPKMDTRWPGLGHLTTWGGRKPSPRTTQAPQIEMRDLIMKGGGMLGRQSEATLHGCHCSVLMPGPA